jgi:hypothetical protein
MSAWTLFASDPEKIEKVPLIFRVYMDSYRCSSAVAPAGGAFTLSTGVDEQPRANNRAN